MEILQVPYSETNLEPVIILRTYESPSTIKLISIIFSSQYVTGRRKNQKIYQINTSPEASTQKIRLKISKYSTIFRLVRTC